MLFETLGITWQLVLQALLWSLVTAVVWFVIKLYNVRSRMLALQRQGLAGDAPISSHIWSSIAVTEHPGYPELSSAFYLDNWPFATPMLIVTSPEGAYQACQDRSLPKFAALRSFMKPLTGGEDLVTMEGKQWQTWRTIFNPGFSASHLMTLVPGIVKDTSVFCEILRDHAKNGQIFSLEQAAIRVTLDIIGRVSLNNEWHAQGAGNEMISALNSQVHWLCFGSEGIPMKLFNPLRPLINWYNTRRMNRYVTREFEEHLYINQNDDENDQSRKRRSVIDLALKSYLDQNPSSKTTMAGVDENFKTFAIAQTKLFIFSGHDTTSSTICYIFHLLSQDPEALGQLRAEHSRVLGSDVSRTASNILHDPYLLNQLPYTVAVIKEALRLFPAASSTRGGEPGYSIKETSGLQYPTSGFLVWVVHQAMHRDPAYWPQPDSFMPQRWLDPEGHPLHPVKGAWRPFEFGPRNCIGQKLAMLEMKAIVAMTAREFNIRSAYDEWDIAHPTKKSKRVGTERAYQIVIGSAHPCDRFPCKVATATEH